MKEEGFNPNAVITDQVIDALANIQDHEPGSFREHTEKLTDILLDDFELMEPDNLKRNLATKLTWLKWQIQTLKKT